MSPERPLQMLMDTFNLNRNYGTNNLVKPWVKQDRTETLTDIDFELLIRRIQIF